MARQPRAAGGVKRRRSSTEKHARFPDVHGTKHEAGHEIRNKLEDEMSESENDGNVQEATSKHSKRITHSKMEAITSSHDFADEQEFTVNKLTKFLAHTSNDVRERALNVVFRWLKDRDSISRIDMLKLWRGLYFVIWYADKSAPQLELFQRLSALLLNLEFQRALEYMDGFWTVHLAEWSMIDALRLDKYLKLVRLMMHATFALLAKSKWKSENVDAIVSLLTELPLSNDYQQRNRGLFLHVTDVFLTELDDVLGESNGLDAASRLNFETLIKLLKPFFAVLGDIRSDQTLVEKVCKELFEPLYGTSMVFADAETPEYQFPHLHLVIVGFSKSVADLFNEIASSSSMISKRKKLLIKLRDKFHDAQSSFEEFAMTEPSNTKHTSHLYPDTNSATPASNHKIASKDQHVPNSLSRKKSVSVNVNANQIEMFDKRQRLQSKPKSTSATQQSATPRSALKRSSIISAVSSQNSFSSRRQKSYSES